MDGNNNIPNHTKLRASSLGKFRSAVRGIINIKKTTGRGGGGSKADRWKTSSSKSRDNARSVNKCSTSETRPKSGGRHTVYVDKASVDEKHKRDNLNPSRSCSEEHLPPPPPPRSQEST